MKKSDVTCHYYSERVGWLELCASERGVRSVSYVEKPPIVQRADGHPMLESLVKELDGYFSGKAKTFSAPLDPDGGTEFERRVWQELKSIPYGETRSYKEIAELVGAPLGARAVGSANKKNPVAIVVPCHRVIKSDGGLGGYNSGLARKRELLDLEGISTFS